MKKLGGSLLLLLAAGAVGYWFWRRQRGPVANALPTDGNVGYIGSNTQQNVSEDLINSVLDKTFAYVRGVNAGCWRVIAGDDGYQTWQNSVTGQTDIIHVSQPGPANQCRNQLAP